MHTKRTEMNYDVRDLVYEYEYRYLYGHLGDVYLMKQVSPFDELLNDEEAARVLFIVIVILAYAIARCNVPVAHKTICEIFGHERSPDSCNLRMRYLSHNLGFFDKSEAVTTPL